MNIVLLFLALALNGASPADPCTSGLTVVRDGQSYPDLRDAPFNWTSRVLDWSALGARFQVSRQHSLLSSEHLKIEAVEGPEQLAVVVGRRAGGPWCVTGTWDLYFGGKGLQVWSTQALRTAQGYLVLIDAVGTYSSPPGATERILRLIRIDRNGALEADDKLSLEIGDLESVELAPGAGNEPTLLVRRVGPVDLYRISHGRPGKEPIRSLPGIGARGSESTRQLIELCKAEPGQPANQEVTASLVHTAAAFEGTLVSLGELRYPTESDEGSVLEMTFRIVKVHRDLEGGLAPGRERTLVVPISSPLMQDLMAAGGSPFGSLPEACLSRLGLSDTPTPGENYLVAARETWEGEQAAFPPRKADKAGRALFARLAGEASAVDRFKAGFPPLHSFDILDQGETFEITVHGPIRVGAESTTELYILDKARGTWKKSPPTPPDTPKTWK